MSNILSTFNNICTIHPIILSSDCMRCATPSATKQNSQMEMVGTSDLPTSRYPELDTDTLAGPSNPYFLAYPKTKPLSIQPQRALSVRFITGTWYPAIEERAEHDYYPERFALSPDERVPMYAGNHYSDRFALDEEDMRDMEDLALFPAGEVPKPKRKRGRPRKCEKVYEKEKKPEEKKIENSQPMKVDEDGSDTSDCIVVEVPGDWKRNIKLKRRMNRTEIAEPRSAKKLRKENTIVAQQIKT